MSDDNTRKNLVKTAKVAKGPKAVGGKSAKAEKAERDAVEALKETVLMALDDLKANDVVCLDVTSLTPLMDYMVIASGTSSRHVKSMVDNVVVESKAIKVMPIGVEGLELSEWVLIDLGDIVVHVMLPTAREFYDLERLWAPASGGPQVDDNSKQ